MNKKYLAALVCGFAASVLTTIPGLEGIACCTLVPIASGFSVFLFKKSQPDLLKIETGTGLLLGFLTGIIAAIFASSFEIVITLLTRSSDLIASMPEAEKVIKDMNLGPAAEESMNILKQMVTEIKANGFSFIYSLIITITNLITYSIFGALGGLVGTAILNKRNLA
jgi:hypothetical protein